MTYTEKARRFAELHIPGTPLVLCNIWDAGSARTVAAAGAHAIATGSWAMAAAQGFKDGEGLPLDSSLDLLSRIIHTTDLPVTHDFETGYATDPETLANNVARVIKAGAVGINFEDQVMGEGRLYSIKDQCARIAAIRARANASDANLFINARTDVFYQGAKSSEHPALMPEAIARAKAYHEAGANGIFVPGLKHTSLVAEFCKAVPLPVNIMKVGNMNPVEDYAKSGVARISQGAGPYLSVMDALMSLAKH